MTQKPLHLLQGISEDPAIAFRRSGRTRQGTAIELALNQHCEHMDCEGMPELMWTDVDRQSVRLAAMARPCECDFPGIWAHRLADLCHPQNRWFDWRAIRITDDQTLPFVRREDFQRDSSPVDE